MAYSSFRQFIDALDQAGELKRVSIPVETDLVISEWANREMKSPDGGKALLFEQPMINGKHSRRVRRQPDEGAKPRVLWLAFL